MKALIADDSKVARRLLREMLAELAPEIETDSAENGGEALAMHVVRRYDMIFLDVTMPKMGGLEALGEIRKRKDNVFVALLSARDEDEVLDAAAALGASAFLAKPFSSLHIQAALRLAIGRPVTARVLLIDDSSAQRGFLSTALQALDMECDVEEALDGPEGLRKALTSAYDLVFLDVNMPRLNGMEVLREIKQTSARAKVVMLSGDVDDALIADATALGADACLPKPIVIADVLGCVLDMLDVRRPAERPAA